MGPGIAGVASTLEADSIKIYEEHQKYNEWEFIYDMAKDRTGMGNRNTGIGTPVNQMGGNNPSSGSGSSGFGSSGFGSSGFGSSTFGSSGFGGSPSGPPPAPPRN
jgi:hypothetical protein